MKEELIQQLEAFLHQEDFGKNWDGAYQDAIPAIRRYFTSNGFETRLINESESPSRDTELVASKEVSDHQNEQAPDDHGITCEKAIRILGCPPAN